MIPKAFVDCIKAELRARRQWVGLRSGGVGSCCGAGWLVSAFIREKVFVDALDLYDATDADSDAKLGHQFGKIRKSAGRSDGAFSRLFRRDLAPMPRHRRRNRSSQAQKIPRQPATADFRIRL